MVTWLTQLHSADYIMVVLSSTNATTDQSHWKPQKSITNWASENTSTIKPNICLQYFLFHMKGSPQGREKHVPLLLCFWNSVKV